MSKLLEYYQLLGVTASAGITDITTSYRRLCRLYHPDVSDNPDSEELMKRINVAYSALREKLRREAVVRERFKGTGRPVRRYTAAEARAAAASVKESTAREAYSVLRNYFKAINSGDYAAAYGFLSDYDKRHITSGDFIVWRKSVARLYPMREFAIKEEANGAEVAFKDGRRFKARKYHVEITEMELQSGEVQTGEVIKLVIYENNSWRVFLGYTDVGELTRSFDEKFETGRRNAAAKMWEEYYDGLCPEYNMLSLKGMRKTAQREIYRHNRYGGVLTFAVFSAEMPPGAPEVSREEIRQIAAKTLNRGLRETDTPAYAGDGVFAVLFVELRKKHAQMIVERIAERIRRDTRHLQGGPPCVECAFETYTGAASVDMFSKILGRFNKNL